MYRHLLDGSRAANRLGWQWTAGALTGKAYGFSRWQVEKRAPGLCGNCPLERKCPIADWPANQEREPLALTDQRLKRDDDLESTAGPTAPRDFPGEPEAVWITAESLSDRDPAAAAYPDLLVLFVFDQPLLRSLRLSVNRLVFLAQSLADLSTRREVQLWLGDPVEILHGRPLATTFALFPVGSTGQRDLTWSHCTRGHGSCGHKRAPSARTRRGSKAVARCDAAWRPPRRGRSHLRHPDCDRAGTVRATRGRAVRGGVQQRTRPLNCPAGLGCRRGPRVLRTAVRRTRSRLPGHGQSCGRGRASPASSSAIRRPPTGRRWRRSCTRRSPLTRGVRL